MDKDLNGYFDIDIDVDKLAGSDLDSAFLLQDLRARKLFLEGDIDQFTIGSIIKNILQYNADDDAAGIPVGERKPIRLYVSSNGGEVDSGYGLVDAIICSKTPVYTINMNKAYSMAFLIMIAGHKRYSFPNARFLLHDGSNFVYDSTSKVKDMMAFQDSAEDRTKSFVVAHTGITSKLYDKNYRREWWMFPEEAKEQGVIDYIVGVDSELSEVI